MNTNGVSLQSIPIIASYLWNMFDFGVPMWSRGGVPARNLKVDHFDRKIQKRLPITGIKLTGSKDPYST